MAPEPFFGAVMDAQSAARWREEARAAGRRIVFTNGCFDVLHVGHAAYLAWARAQGDALIVGLNSDDSVRALKGLRRPLVPFDERAKLLAALRSVDVVTRFDEMTPEVLLEQIAPDVHVKSSQYREEELPERSVVLAHGGEIRLAPHIEGSSTTDLIARIAARYT